MYGHASLVVYIHLYSHKLQLQNNKLKKTKEKETHNVSKNITRQMHITYTQQNRKVPVT